MQVAAFLARRRIIVACLAVFLATPAWARDTNLDRASLKGLTAVQVQVTPMDQDAERDGLTRSQLQTDIESRLRQAGIGVDTSAPARLSLEVLTEKEPRSAIYVFNMTLALLQSVNLERNPVISDPAAATWSVAFGGVVSAVYLSQVRSAVSDLVDRFIAAYLEQNPKK